MIPYIFRKYKGGYNPNEIKCWSPSKAIETDNFDVEDIIFTRGASKAGTSIPSPLARMELFDTAFHIVASDQKNNLKGKTIYHQLVSDCLDVIQLIFNSKNSEIGVGKKIWFKEWKVKDNIEKLKSKGENHPHNLLAKSFSQIFFDKINPRFSGTDSIFLIYYENKLLGGTSPLTLFFTTPNWARYINDGAIANIPQSADGDVFFDDEYKALYERDNAFIAYLYKLLLLNKVAFAKAEGLRKYINKTVDKIEQDQPGWKLQFQPFLQQSNSNNFSDDETFTPQTNLLDNEYSKLLTNVDNKFLTINGIYFYHQNEEDVIKKIKANSDFLIRANKDATYSSEVSDNGVVHQIPPPLVLVNGMNVAGDYLEKNSPWNPNTRVMKTHYWGIDNSGNPQLIPLYERNLPQGNNLSSIVYPYITTDDFLEDNLIEMPFKLNNEKFFTGFNGDFKYLLPIRKSYFNFFSLDDLKQNLSIIVNDGNIKVNLKVPIRNRKGIAEIVFTKTYSKGQKEGVWEALNGLGIFPFYKIIDKDKSVTQLNEYTIFLADKNNNLEVNSLEFYKYSEIISKTPVKSSSIERSIKGLNSGTRYYTVEDSFDIIELQLKDVDNITSGLIIPQWNEQKVIATGKQFAFAIDFGTSNSHIAFSGGDNKYPVSFEIGENDLQVVLLNKPENNKNINEKYSLGFGRMTDIYPIINREFIPLILGTPENSDFSFPIRTATCEKTDFISKDANLFGNINIGFYIDNEVIKPNDINYTTNLKWLFENNTGDTANTKRIESFFTGLLLLIRNKVILNGGEIQKTKICWMKPQSMSEPINEQLVAAWKASMKKVFKNLDNIFDSHAISESLAPYYYFKNGPEGIFKNRAAESINIDIGGGTTDVIYLNKKSSKYISTSFRFAANDIWGSGYNSGLKDNGFILNFLNFDEKNRRERTQNDDILESFLRNSGYKSEDVISLLFKYDNVFKFTESIKRNNTELIFILYLHYSAIIYHIVQLLESKEIEELPKYFTFTGKGSQYLKLMCGEDKLTEFTTLILKSFTKLKLDSDFKVFLSDKPKETTANGGVLYITANDKIILNSENEMIHYGGDIKFNSDFITGYTKNEEAIKNEDFKSSVLENLQDFIDKLLLVKTENGIVNERLMIVKFLNGYNINNLEDYYNELTKGNCKYGGMIFDSHESYIEELSRAQKMSETFFFYGLKDSLYELSKYIAENK